MIQKERGPTEIFHPKNTSCYQRARTHTHHTHMATHGDGQRQREIEEVRGRQVEVKKARYMQRWGQ